MSTVVAVRPRNGTVGRIDVSATFMHDRHAHPLEFAAGAQSGKQHQVGGDAMLPALRMTSPADSSRPFFRLLLFHLSKHESSICQSITLPPIRPRSAGTTPSQLSVEKRFRVRAIKCSGEVFAQTLHGFPRGVTQGRPVKSHRVLCPYREITLNGSH